MNRTRQFGLLVAAVGWMGIAYGQPVPMDYDPGKNPAAERAAAEQAAAVKRQVEAERQRRKAAEAEAAELKRQLAEAKRKSEDSQKQAVETQKKVGAGGTAAGPAPFSVFRDTLKDGSPGPEMVVIPPGSFEMGATAEEQAAAVRDGARKEWTDREGPRHPVSIRKAFALGRTEVTVGEFRAFVKTAGYQTDAELDAAEKKGCYSLGLDDGKSKWDWRAGRHWNSPGFEQEGTQPVVCVSWNDARAYARWLSEQTGKTYRLPSEAEWEYAARGGTTTSRYWGDKPDEACTYANVADRTKSPTGGTWSLSIHECSDGHWHTAPAGSFKANAYGLHDMLGNAWEWVEDCWNDSYAGNRPGAEVPRAEGDCGRRALRGGSWINAPHKVRAANRIRTDKAFRDNNNGFRLARTLP